uniref:putative nuclease HARBI1 n=1 Tax=Solea senegalensis TaxID=28829 RepID=UPI001CD8B3D5|nr:putative nuclease HARBI1 [Solea senegalensis]
MACPFIDNPVNEEARIIRRAFLPPPGLFQDRTNPLTHTDAYLWESCTLFFHIGFPNVLGCIDCSHVRIVAPSGPVERDYVDRRNDHSLNVQMICDANYLITNIEAKWPGGVHDARIFRASSVAQRLAQREFEGILLGDRGYPCLPYLLTPYSDPGTEAEEAFNGALNSTRARIEMVFGQLKSRFQCLKYWRVAPERACDITVACAILHNIATIRSHPQKEAPGRHTGGEMGGPQSHARRHGWEGREGPL